MDGDCSSSSDDASRKRLRRLPLGEKVQRFFYETFSLFLCYREVCMKKWILIILAVLALSISCATAAVEENSAVEEETVLSSFNTEEVASEIESNESDSIAEHQEITEDNALPATEAEEAVIDEIAVDSNEDQDDGYLTVETEIPEATENFIMDPDADASSADIVIDEIPLEEATLPLPEVSDAEEVALDVEAEASDASAEAIEEPQAAAIEAESPEDEVISVPETPKSEEKKHDDVILKEELSSAALQIMGIFIIIIVLFTASVAIRSANKMPLSRGVSALIAILFTALPMIISYFVIGKSLYWLLYLMLLFSYLIFRTKDRGYYFQ